MQSKVSRLLSLVIVIALMVTITPQESRALYEDSALTSGGWYYFINEHSGLPMDASSSSDDLIQWTFHGHENQQFKLIYNSTTGYYNIESRYYPGKYMTVNGNYDTNGSFITMQSANGGIAQDWEIIRNANGTYRFISRCSGGIRTAAIQYAATYSGEKLIHWTYGTSRNDNWYFKPVGGSTTSTRYISSAYGAEQGTDTWDAGLFSAPKYQDVVVIDSNATSLLGYTRGTFNTAGYRKDILGRVPNGESAELIYWSGHSLSGKMSYYDGWNNWVSYTDGFNPTVYIGSEILSYDAVNGYYSNSAWDANQKWGIIAACNQLKSPYWEGWAKVLLGKNNRAHMVCGYAQTAPAGPIDTNIAQQFMAYASNGYSIFDAWSAANVDMNQPLWATVFHYENKDDCIPGYGSVSATTSRYSVPDIRVVWGDDTSSSSSLRSYTEPFQEAYIFSVNAGGTVKSKIKTEESIITSSVLQEGMQVSTSDRRVQVRNGNFISDKAITCDEEQAIQKAINYAVKYKLMSRAMLSEMDYEIYPIKEASINLLGSANNLSTPKTIGYSIVLRRMMNGVPFAPEFGNSLKVLLNEDGVFWSSSNWENISAKAHTSLIDQAKVNGALEKFTDSNILKKELLYVPSDLAGTKESYDIIPAWKVETDDGIYYVSAVTGEILNKSASSSVSITDPAPTGAPTSGQSPTDSTPIPQQTSN